MTASGPKQTLVVVKIGAKTKPRIVHLYECAAEQGKEFAM
jgi:hypothetical protein